MTRGALPPLRDIVARHALSASKALGQNFLFDEQLLDRIAAMPGVPSEMKGMFHEWVLPRLVSAGTHGRVIRHARINCFGVGESAAEQMLGDLTARGRDPEVGITVHEATITLRIVAEATTVSECLAKIAATRATIYERIGDYAFGEEDDELQHTVVRLLNQRGRTLACAESGTGGLIAHRLTDVAGSERCFLGGCVAPRVRAAGMLLAGVPLPEQETTQAFSGESAGQLAAACRQALGADFGLSVSEFSQTESVEGAAAPPVAFIALDAVDGLEIRELNLAGDPAIIRSRTAKAALNLLRQKLQQ